MSSDNDRPAESKSNLRLQYNESSCHKEPGSEMLGLNPSIVLQKPVGTAAGEKMPARPAALACSEKFSSTSELLAIRWSQPSGFLAAGPRRRVQARGPVARLYGSSHGHACNQTKPRAVALMSCQDTCQSVRCCLSHGNPDETRAYSCPMSPRAAIGPPPSLSVHSPPTLLALQ